MIFIVNYITSYYAYTAIIRKSAFLYIYIYNEHMYIHIIYYRYTGQGEVTIHKI